MAYTKKTQGGITANAEPKLPETTPENKQNPTIYSKGINGWVITHSSDSMKVSEIAKLDIKLLDAVSDFFFTLKDKGVDWNSICVSFQIKETPPREEVVGSNRVGA